MALRMHVAMMAVTIVVLTVLLFPHFADAQYEPGGYYPKPSRDDPVMSGFDIVQYHFLDASEDGVWGSPTYSHRHTNGYLYYFSSQKNLDLFKADPGKYLPQYGGFCAWGVAWEYANEGWPWAADHLGPPCGPRTGWAILDGKLYCSIWRSYQDDFNARSEEGIRLANKRWIEWYGSLDAGPQNNGCYAWNYPECLARTIHDAISPLPPDPVAVPDANTPPPAEDFYVNLPSTDINDVSSVSEAWAVNGKVAYAWSLTNISAKDPLLTMSLRSTLGSNNYVAFGTSKALMNGPMVVCHADATATTCKGYRGTGMGVSQAPDIDVKVRTSTVHSNGSFTVTFTVPASHVRIEPFGTRALFSSGTFDVVTKTPFPHLPSNSGREVVLNMNFFRNVFSANTPTNPEPTAPPPPASLPGDLHPLHASSTPTFHLSDNRASVSWRILNSPSTRKEFVEISMTTREMNRYVAFGFAKKLMTGIIFSCRMISSVTGKAECKEWQGNGNNLEPITDFSRPPHWQLRSGEFNSTHRKFIIIAETLNVLDAATLDSRGDDGEGVRSILAVGDLAQGSGTPLMHAATDRTHFLLDNMLPPRTPVPGFDGNISNGQSSAASDFGNTKIFFAVTLTLIFFSLLS